MLSWGGRFDHTFPERSPGNGSCCSGAGRAPGDRQVNQAVCYPVNTSVVFLPITDELINKEKFQDILDQNFSLTQSPGENVSTFAPLQ